MNKMIVSIGGLAVLSFAAVVVFGEFDILSAESEEQKCYIPIFYDGPIFHKVEKGETLWSITNCFYGDMIAMDEDPINLRKAIIELIGTNNGLEHVSKIREGQSIEMPYLTPEFCATLVSEADWVEIDKFIQPPLRPVPRPSRP